MARVRWSPLTWFVVALAVAACLAAVWAYRGRVGQPPRAAQPAAPLPGGVRTPDLAPVNGPRFTQANVVVISVDTLRRDHLAPYGAAFETAAASRLAREGVVFEHAVSQVPLTLPSHASLFTGLYPAHHAVRDNGGFVLGNESTTLAERFMAAGYKTAGFVSAYVLHSSWGIGQGHETYDDFFDYAGLESRSLTDVERPAAPVVDAALAWLRQPRRGEHPFYLWVHIFDPHLPYAPPEEYRRKAPTPYAGEVMYADAQVARLLDALDTMGVRRNTIVVYLSDHGESLGEHGEPTHGIFLYGATLDVPLIIAPPPGGSLGSPRVGARRPARARPGPPRGRHADGARPGGPACPVGSRRREPSADGGAGRSVGRVRHLRRTPRTRSPGPCPTRRPTTRGSATTGASSSRSKRRAGSTCARRGPSSTTCARIRRSSTTSPPSTRRSPPRSPGTSSR